MGEFAANLRRQMHDHHEGGAGIGRQKLQQFAYRFDTACRRADADDGRSDWVARISSLAIYASESGV
jgi:HPt (histidine-containing phosphotransfer) domain-containing protein